MAGKRTWVIPPTATGTVYVNSALLHIIEKVFSYCRRSWSYSIQSTMKFEKHKEEFDYLLLRTCASCGNKFTGRYCNRCGEEVIDKREKSLSFGFRQLINSLITVENRITRTLKMILFRSGEYS